MIGLNHHQSELRERGLDMIKTLFSRQFVVAFLLTLLCSLAGSVLGGVRNWCFGNCLDSRDADAVCSARRCLQSAWNRFDLQ